MSHCASTGAEDRPDTIQSVQNADREYILPLPPPRPLSSLARPLTEQMDRVHAWQTQQEDLSLEAPPPELALEASGEASTSHFGFDRQRPARQGRSSSKSPGRSKRRSRSHSPPGRHSKRGKNPGEEVAKEPKRRITTPAQVDILMEDLRKNPFPSGARREQLAKETGMTPRQVQVWFQNRRQTDKYNRGRYVNDSVPPYNLSYAATTPVASTTIGFPAQYPHLPYANVPSSMHYPPVRYGLSASTPPSATSSSMQLDRTWASSLLGQSDSGSHETDHPMHTAALPYRLAGLPSHAAGPRLAAAGQQRSRSANPLSLPLYGTAQNVSGTPPSERMSPPPTASSSGQSWRSDPSDFPTLHGSSPLKQEFSEPHQLYPGLAARVDVLRGRPSESSLSGASARQDQTSSFFAPTHASLARSQSAAFGNIPDASSGDPSYPSGRVTSYGNPSHVDLQLRRPSSQPQLSLSGFPSQTFPGLPAPNAPPAYRFGASGGNAANTILAAASRPSLGGRRRSVLVAPGETEPSDLRAAQPSLGITRSSFSSSPGEPSPSALSPYALLQQQQQQQLYMDAASGVEPYASTGQPAGRGEGEPEMRTEEAKYEGDQQI